MWANKKKSNLHISKNILLIIIILISVVVAAAVVVCAQRRSCTICTGSSKSLRMTVNFIFNSLYVYKCLVLKLLRASGRQVCENG